MLLLPKLHQSSNKSALWKPVLCFTKGLRDSNWVLSKRCPQKPQQKKPVNTDPLHKQFHTRLVKTKKKALKQYI